MRYLSTPRRFAFIAGAAALALGALASAGALIPRESPAVSPGSSSAAPASTQLVAGPSSSPTFVPPPTIPEPSSTDLAARLPYYCGNGEVFHIESLSGPANAQEGTDPAFAPVQALATRLGLAATYWWLVYRSETRAEFLGRPALRTMSTLRPSCGPEAPGRSRASETARSVTWLKACRRFRGGSIQRTHRRLVLAKFTCWPGTFAP